MTKPKPKHMPKREEPPTVKAIRAACKDLYVAGWKTVHLTYQGSGDSCDSFEFSLENDEAVVGLNFVKATALPPSFDTDKFENLLLELLPDGFENNEGGDGTVVIDTATGAINVKHNWYYTESRQEEWSF